MEQLKKKGGGGGAASKGVTIGAIEQQTINALLTRVNELIDKLMSH